MLLLDYYLGQCPVEFPYSGFPNLVEQIGSTLGDIIIINHVSLADFNQICSEREEHGLGFRLSLYTADPKRLIITIPTGVCEMLHRHLDHLIGLKNGGMGLQPEELSSIGAEAFAHLDGAGHVMSQGEGDSCLQPLVRLQGGFPTVVIEAGYMQSWDSLQQKARWWFAASNFDVKIVILTKVDQSGGWRITIEKWKAVEAALQPGVGTQAQENAPAQPACVQCIHITHAHGDDPANPESYHVTAPLNLEFVDVYLQQPIEGQGDIVLSIVELQHYAVAVWRKSWQ